MLIDSGQAFRRSAMPHSISVSKQTIIPLAIGIATILATVFAMALADAFVKKSSSDMTLWQIYVLRSVIVVPILFLITKRKVYVAGFGWVFLRSIALALMYLSIYGVLPVLDLSVIAAALYTAPLFITGLSAFVMKERITSRHWIAILIGFAGVLIIVKPTTSDFSLLALVPVFAAFMYAIAAILTRAKCSHVSAPILALWLNMTLFTVGSVVSLLMSFIGDVFWSVNYPFLLGAWSFMTAQNWQVIGILAVLMVGISIGLAKAYQSPHPQVIATFDYAFLIFAGFWGYVFFGEIPDAATLVGMVFIACAGIIVLFTRPLDRAPVIAP
jgi:drug/metabolite transporter (DMT)-like permease